MHAIVHVEIPVTNMKRAKEWYGKIFGWTFQDFGKDFTLWSPPGGGVGGGFNLLKKIPAKGSVRAGRSAPSVIPRNCGTWMSHGEALPGLEIRS